MASAGTSRLGKNDKKKQHTKANIAKAGGEKKGKNKSSRVPLLRSHFFCFGNMSKFA